ncbi:hypothetical protein [uncultured Jannaschia sp.]|uniref:hypothetical protein n=1 Tax=uncultured Jannaschia sp. TaxID=293347 RepID=UPI002611F6D4|nr:hypothetical protein [uncultured Jannaschia sp.]
MCSGRTPDFATRHMAEATEAALASMGRTRDEFDCMLCHPGVAKVIVALETALGIEQGALDLEREV